MKDQAHANQLARELDGLRERLAAADASELSGLAVDAIESLGSAVEALRLREAEVREHTDGLGRRHHALEEMALRYTELFEAALDPYLLTDSDGLVLDANRAAAALLQRQLLDLPGKPLSNFVDLPLRHDFRSRLRALGRSASRIEFDLRLRRQDGVAFDTVVAVMNLPRRGEAPCLLWQIRDVTEKRQLEQQLWELNAEVERRVEERTRALQMERARLLALIERLPMAAMLTDNDGRPVVLNAQARLMIEGLEDPQNVVYFESGRRLQHDERPLARALSHGAVTLDRRLEVKAGGQRLTLQVSAMPIFTGNGRREGAVVVWEDVSAQARRERAEREFISNAAHELRTPVAAIAAAVEVLQSGAKEQPQERDLFLSHIERECERLRDLGRGLLILARAQAQQEEPKLELVALRPLLDELAAELRPPQAIRVRVECPEQAATLSNPELLRQAVLNLARNAVLYTPEGEVVLSVEPLGAERLAIEIRDTGTGIPTEVQDRVFERFDRGGRVDADGYGLGLGIAAQSAEAVGGRVELVSSDQRGTVIRLVVPVARMLAEAAQGEAT